MAWGLVLMILAVAGLAYGAAVALGVRLLLRSVPLLAGADLPEPARWPTLSVIVPARDEAADLEAAVRSRLAEGYPALELVLVDDRSSDGTGEIVDRLAREDGRVKAVHVTSLPEGWLGKLHALEIGYRAAGGELLLFSDADVHVAPGAFRRAVALLERDGLDQLGAAPELWSSGPALDAVFAVFLRLLWLAVRPWAIADPRSSASFGVGAFSLVRRRALEASPGFEHLRQEQIDDAGLGQMLKRSGARCGAANGRGLLGLHYYRSVGEMAAGLEKFGARVPVPVMLLGMGALVGVELGPWVALVLGDGWTRGVGGVGAALTLGSTVVVARWSGKPVGPALFAPLAVLVLAGMLARAGVLAAARGGVRWRGTFYRSEALRAGSRYRVG